MHGAGWNNACKKKFQHKILPNNYFFRLKIMCLWTSYKKKKKNGKNIFFVSLKSTKKGIGSGSWAGSGSISQRHTPGIQIRIRTKMSRIPNTEIKSLFFWVIRLNFQQITEDGNKYRDWDHIQCLKQHLDMKYDEGNRRYRCLLSFDMIYPGTQGQWLFQESFFTWAGTEPCFW